MSIETMARVWSDPYFNAGRKSELLVALALADFTNDKDGKAWPSIETLAAKARTSVRRAQDCCRSLEAAGKLKIRQGGGMNGTNAYFLTLPPRNGCTPPAISMRAVAPSPPQRLQEGGAISSHAVAPKPLGTVSEPLIEPLLSPAESVSVSAFDEFWKAYPKKKSKADAERAWRKNRCEPIALTIIAAVRSWAQSYDWKKEGGQFIPYPASWLNSRGWEDELKSNAGTTSGQWPTSTPQPAGAPQDPAEEARIRAAAKAHLREFRKTGRLPQQQPAHDPNDTEL